VWSQHWTDVLFLHWQAPLAALRSQVPAPLEIATYEGRPWVSLVLFRLRVRPRWLPFMPLLSDLVEVNLRTYVRWGERPGIWFLTVHADNRWAIHVARRLTPLPYVRAAMRYQRSGNLFQFEACRPSAPRFDLGITFLPGADGAVPGAGTLDEWLLERYRLFACDRHSILVQAEVAHPPWITRGVSVAVATNSLGRPVGLDLSRPPDWAHFSGGVRAHFGAFREVKWDWPDRAQQRAGPPSRRALIRAGGAG
jgi:uncharacterized protein YqjF (DUF2071 family)